MLIVPANGSTPSSYTSRVRSTCSSQLMPAKEELRSTQGCIGNPGFRAPGMLGPKSLHPNDAKSLAVQVGRGARPHVASRSMCLWKGAWYELPRRTTRKPRWHLTSATSIVSACKHCEAYCHNTKKAPTLCDRYTDYAGRTHTPGSDRLTVHFTEREADQCLLYV